MRRVAIFDSVTKAVQATVTCVDGIVTIEGEGERVDSLVKAARNAERSEAPSDASGASEAHDGRRPASHAMRLVRRSRQAEVEASRLQ